MYVGCGAWGRTAPLCLCLGAAISDAKDRWRQEALPGSRACRRQGQPASHQVCLWTGPRGLSVHVSSWNLFTGWWQWPWREAFGGCPVRLCQRTQTGDSGPLQGKCGTRDEGCEGSCMDEVHLRTRPAREKPDRGDGWAAGARGAEGGAPCPQTHSPSKTALRFLGVSGCCRDRTAGFQTQGAQHEGQGALLPTLPDQTGRAKRGLGRNRRASSWHLSHRSPLRALAGRSAAVRSSGHSLRNWAVSSGSCHVSARPGRS